MWDSQQRRLTHALLVAGRDAGSQPIVVRYWDDTETIRLVRERGTWVVTERETHGFSVCPVVQLTNRPRASRLGGRSEISKAVRSYTDDAVRTLNAMAVAADFYGHPQRFISGASTKAFPEGAELKAGQSSLWVVDQNEDGTKPEIAQFPASTPAPYLEQLRGLTQLLAAEAGIPPTYLGMVTDNPASADAIPVGEAF